MKQKTIGLNPLEEYLTSAKATKEEPEEPQQEAIPLAISEPATKQRITIHISSAVIDRVKNAVYWEPGLTLAGFAEEALAQALENLEAERGAPFPQRREHRLRGGRPII